jgi:F-type H+-transporting ATPase subunit b
MLDIDWTLGGCLISVMVFLVLMNKLLFKPLSHFMETRDKGIRDDLDEAARLRQQAEAALATYESALNTARRDMTEQGVAAQRALEAKQREIIEEARGNAGRMVADAQASITREAQEARSQLADQARALARLVVSKLIGREVVR